MDCGPLSFRQHSQAHFQYAAPLFEGEFLMWIGGRCNGILQLFRSHLAPLLTPAEIHGHAVQPACQIFGRIDFLQVAVKPPKDSCATAWAASGLPDSLQAVRSTNRSCRRMSCSKAARSPACAASSTRRGVTRSRHREGRHKQARFGYIARCRISRSSAPLSTIELPFMLLAREAFSINPGMSCS